MFHYRAAISRPQRSLALAGYCEPFLTLLTPHLYFAHDTFHVGYRPANNNIFVNNRLFVDELKAKITASYFGSFHTSKFYQLSIWVRRVRYKNFNWSLSLTCLFSTKILDHLICNIRWCFSSSYGCCFHRSGLSLYLLCHIRRQLQNCTSIVLLFYSSCRLCVLCAEEASHSFLNYA